MLQLAKPYASFLTAGDLYHATLDEAETIITYPTVQWSCLLRGRNLPKPEKVEIKSAKKSKKLLQISAAQWFCWYGFLLLLQ